MEEKKPKPCGNPECRVSTGIHDGLTFGSGHLDTLGFWEKPCRACAAAWDINRRSMRKEMVRSRTKVGFSRIDTAKWLRDSTWLRYPAWPFSPARAALALATAPQRKEGE